MVIVVIGVSGVGKTTIAERLAARLGWPFIEGDDLHPQANQDKMHRGIALTDADRQPWLAAVRDRIDAVQDQGGHAVLTCSALTRAYRALLRREGVHFVYLRGSPELVRQRLRGRTGHFFEPRLLGSQFDILEEPDRALTVDASGTPGEVAERILSGLDLPERPPPAD